MRKTGEHSDRYIKTADGALIRYQSWSPLTETHIKPRILILLGRATAIEKLSHIVLKLRKMGYEVWAFDWRGQGLSTRELGRRGYIDSYETYLSDLHLFITTFLKNESRNRPTIVLGQSMGAHIGLRYMAENPGIIQAALMTSPMLEINTGIYSKRMARLICKLMRLIGCSKNYVFGHSEYDPALEPFEGNLVTHNEEIFYQHRRLQIERPELILGGATFQWVDATLESSRILLRESYLKKIQVPVHIIAAEDEKVVDNRMVQKVCEWIGSCSFEMIPGTRHQILSESHEIQERVLYSLERLRQACFPLPIVDLPMEKAASYAHVKEKLIGKPAPETC
jgi:lysophospholipase